MMTNSLCQASTSTSNKIKKSEAQLLSKGKDLAVKTVLRVDSVARDVSTVMKQGIPNQLLPV